MHKTIPSCSKAPRGLFVLVGVGRVLTAIANSPGESSRQLLARYAFHARRNLPDKELRSFLLTPGSLNAVHLLTWILHIAMQIEPYLLRLIRSSAYGL